MSEPKAQVVLVTPAQRTAAAYLVRRAEEKGTPLADDDLIRRIAEARTARRGPTSDRPG